MTKPNFETGGMTADRVGDVAPDVKKEVIDDLPYGNNDKIKEALEQIRNDKDWQNKYEKIDAPEAQDKVRDLMSGTFSAGGKLAVAIGLAVLRNQQTKPIQEMREIMEQNDGYVPPWIALVTLPADFPKIAGTKLKRLGSKVGSIVHEAISELREEIMEERLEADIETFIVREGVTKK